MKTITENLKKEYGQKFLKKEVDIFDRSFLRGNYDDYKIKKVGYECSKYSLSLEICGNQFYIKKYQEPVWIGFKSKGGRSDNGMDKDKNRKDVERRARSRFMKLAQGNFDNKNDKFITLTVRNDENGNVPDLRVANSEFEKFIKRLNYYEKKVNSKCEGVKYLTAIENTGVRLHYHLLANIKYIPNSELRKMWGQGFVRINRIRKVDNLGAYLLGYAKKSIGQLVGNKSYLMSSNLRNSNEKFYDDVAEKKIKKMHLTEENLTWSDTYKRKIYKRSAGRETSEEVGTTLVDDLRGTIKLNKKFRKSEMNFHSSFSELIGKDMPK